VALSNFLIAFFALPIAVLFLHEKISAVSVMGGLLILISTIAITIWEYRQSAPDKLIKAPAVE
jgi:drug/metabolite transporter (DMT)-like permease